MLGKSLRIGLRATVLIFTVTVCVTSTWGATETLLRAFDPKFTDGAYPQASLIFDAAGNLYGTTVGGRHLQLRDGVRVVAHSGRGLDGDRCCIASATARTGLIPYAGLIFDAAGNLYGTTNKGGTSRHAGRCSS